MGTSTASTPAAPFSWRTFLTYLGTFMTLVLVVGLLVVLAVGMRPLERIVVAATPPKPITVMVEWPKVKGSDGQGPVTWVPQAQRTALLERARHALINSPNDLSNAAIQRVGQSLEESGWFMGSPTIRRGPENSIVIDGHWRVPAAVVRRTGVDQLIAWDGVPMPLTLPAGQARFPVIESPAMPAPSLGDGTVDCKTAWPGEDMSASLELLQVLLRQPWASQVAGVDASRFANDHLLIVTTTFGTRIVWGGRVSKPALGEVSSTQKLAHLSELYDKHKRIDAGFPMIYVNNTKLQFDISATAQALANVEQAAAEQRAMQR